MMMTSKCGKNKSQFFTVIKAAPWAEKLGRKAKELKNTLGNLVVAVKQEVIWFEFWMKGALVTVKILSSVVGDYEISLINIVVQETH